MILVHKDMVLVRFTVRYVYSYQVLLETEFYHVDEWSLKNNRFFVGQYENRTRRGIFPCSPNEPFRASDHSIMCCFKLSGTEELGAFCRMILNAVGLAGISKEAQPVADNGENLLRTATLQKIGKVG